MSYAKRMQSAALKCKNNNKHHHTWTKAEKKQFAKPKRSCCWVCFRLQRIWAQTKLPLNGTILRKKKLPPPPRLEVFVLKARKLEFESLNLKVLWLKVLWWRGVLVKRGEGGGLADQGDLVRIVLGAAPAPHSPTRKLLHTIQHPANLTITITITYSTITSITPCQPKRLQK